MNSKEFCQSKEWIDFRNKLWVEHFHRGNLKCTYCGWTPTYYPDFHEVDLRHNRLLFDHILPVSKYPHLRLNRDNITLCCTKCNEKKGGLVDDPKLTNIMLQYQKNAKKNLKLDFMNPSKFYRRMEKKNGKYQEYFVPIEGLKTHELYVGA